MANAESVTFNKKIMTAAKNEEPGIQNEATSDETETNHVIEHPCKQILTVWKTLVVILTPIVLLPIPILWPERVGNSSLTKIVFIDIFLFNDIF